MNLTEARTLLVSLLPDGIGTWLDLRPGPDPKQPAVGASDPWLLLDAAAAGLLAGVYGPLDDIEADANPTTATTAGVAAWEAALGLSQTKTAIYGNLAQRRGNIIARLREWGTPTVANIVAAITAATGAVPNVLELARADLDAEIGRAFVPDPSVVPGLGTVTVTAAGSDNAPASVAGVRLTVDITTAGPGSNAYTLQLVSPTGVNASWAAQNTGAQKFISSAFAGCEVNGTWSLQVVDLDGGGGTVTGATLYVDGIGRDTGTGADGFGSAMFQFSVVCDPAECYSATDWDFVRLLVERWAPAHTDGRLVFVQSDGTLCALADDLYAIADNCVAC